MIIKIIIIINIDIYAKTATYFPFWELPHQKVCFGQQQQQKNEMKIILKLSPNLAGFVWIPLFSRQVLQTGR